MLNLDDIQAMSVKLREAVTKANWDEANDVSTNHSFRKLIEQNRCPAIAARMISLLRHNCEQCNEQRRINISFNGRLE